MEINLRLNEIYSNIHNKEWDGLRYKVEMISPKKKNTQYILNNLINEKEYEDIKVSLVHDKEKEVVEIYFNNQYISDVVKSKYKNISKIINQNYEHHFEIQIEKLSNGDYKATPSIFYKTN